MSKPLQSTAAAARSGDRLRKFQPAGVSGTWFALFVLFALNLLNFFDRQLIGALGEPIRK